MSVNRLDQEELAFALAYLVGALPCRAKGVLVLTVDGELVGQYLARHDSRQVDLLLDAARRLTRNFADVMGNGDFAYNLNVGADGATLTLLLDARYVIAINVRAVCSLDAFVGAVQEGLPPLRDLLGVRQ
jgi:hypothetical protein